VFNILVIKGLIDGKMERFFVLSFAYPFYDLIHAELVEASCDKAS